MDMFFILLFNYRFRSCNLEHLGTIGVGVAGRRGENSKIGGAAASHSPHVDLSFARSN